MHRPTSHTGSPLPCGLKASGSNHDTAADTLQNDKEAAKQRYKQAGTEMQKPQASHIKKASKAQVKNLRKILHQNRKKGHKLIFDRDAPCQRLEQVKDTSTNKL